MSNSKQKVSFAYKQVETCSGNQVTSTTCTLEKEGVVIAQETVIPYHNAVDDRVYARKLSFKKAIQLVEDRNERRAFWQNFRASCQQPENAKVRIKGINAMIKRFHGISPDDYETLCAKVKEILLNVKTQKASDNITTEEKEEMKAIPNAEPMAILETA